MARAVGRPSGIRTCRAHCQRTRPHHWRSRSTQSGPRRLGVANESDKPSTISGFKLLNRCVLVYSPPKGVEGNSVLPRDGLVDRPTLVWRRRKSCLRAPVHQNPAPLPPHARGRSGTTRGSSASQPPVVFRPYPPWVVGAGSGRVPGPKFAAGTAAGAAGGFLGRREGQKSVGFCPLGGAHQSAWSLYIMLGHTPRRRCPAGA